MTYDVYTCCKACCIDVSLCTWQQSRYDLYIQYTKIVAMTLNLKYTASQIVNSHKVITMLVYTTVGVISAVMVHVIKSGF